MKAKKKLEQVVPKNIIYRGRRKEDRWVIRDIYHFKFGGYFLDLAAYDGVKSSNTYVLEKYFDWNGICIEPNPEFIPDLKKNRNCILDFSLIGSNKGENVEFAQWGSRSSVLKIAEETMTDQRKKIYRKKNKIILKTELLINVLKKYNAPKFIEFLSLDVEGSEYEVLKNFPLNEYVFGVALIEHQNHEDKIKKIRNLMKKNNYDLVHVAQYDDYYLHKGTKFI